MSPKHTTQTTTTHTFRIVSLTDSKDGMRSKRTSKDKTISVQVEESTNPVLVEMLQRDALAKVLGVVDGFEHRMEAPGAFQWANGQSVVIAVPLVPLVPLTTTKSATIDEGWDLEREVRFGLACDAIDEVLNGLEVPQVDVGDPEVLDEAGIDWLVVILILGHRSGQSWLLPSGTDAAKLV